ncbi:MAG: hypothetical protein HY835_04175 [Anaerolineae bacterium]|nr:hypothetical protein [Anaerolineae bacterium]
MKKILPLLILAALLVGCVLPSSAPAEDKMIQPTLSDAEMQTQLAMMLTAIPTQTEQPALVPTNTLQFNVVTATPGAETATPEAAALPSPTATPEPTQVPPTATPEPTQVPPTATSPAFTAVPGDPRGRLGSPSSTDPMDSATQWIWPTGLNDFTSIGFGNGAMTLTGLNDKLGWRLANPEGTDFGSLYLEATFRTGTCASADQYGLIVRVPVLKEADRGYLFGFSCDGRYGLRKWDGKDGEKGKMTRLIDWKASDAIQKGSNATNRMGIMMVGSRLILYANGQLLGEVSDSTWTSGTFGAYIGALNTDNFSVQIDEMSYWKNPNP